MITCDPWWQDYNRLVWRAELISAPAPSAPGPTGGSVANPVLLIPASALGPSDFETLERAGQRRLRDSLEPLDVHANEDGRRR